MRRIITYRASLFWNPGGSLPKGRRIGESIVECVKDRDDPEVEELFVHHYPTEDASDRDYDISWYALDYEYSDIERRISPWFHVRSRRAFVEWNIDELTLYDQRTACEFCGMNARQMSTLILPTMAKRRPPHGLTGNGNILVNRPQVEAWVAGGVRGAVFLPVFRSRQAARGFQTAKPPSAIDDKFVMERGQEFNENILAKWHGDAFQLIVTGAVEIAAESDIGTNPFSALRRVDEAICPLGHVIGSALMGPLVVTDVPTDGRDFAITRQAIGRKEGCFLPARELLVSRRAEELSRTWKNKWAPFDPLAIKSLPETLRLVEPTS